ncbi:hypothetical protein NXW78_22880 [Bacteroides ovatus]|nr:hypothetical protein [Bacteroides ovatus]
MEMLSAAKELVEIFKFPKENEQLLSSYAIDIRQPAQEQSITGDTPQQTTRWGVDEVGLAAARTHGRNSRIVGRNGHTTPAERPRVRSPRHQDLLRGYRL